MAGETKGSVSCLVIVAANVIVCVTLMRTPWRTEGPSLAYQARTPAQSANTTSTASSGRSRRQSPPLFHPSSLVRTHLAATAARLVPPSGSSSHHPSPSAPTLFDQTPASKSTPHPCSPVTSTSLRLDGTFAPLSRGPRSFRETSGRPRAPDLRGLSWTSRARANTNRHRTDGNTFGRQERLIVGP